MSFITKKAEKIYKKAYDNNNNKTILWDLKLSTKNVRFYYFYRPSWRNVFEIYNLKGSIDVDLDEILFFHKLISEVLAKKYDETISVWFRKDDDLAMTIKHDNDIDPDMQLEVIQAALDRGYVSN